MARIQTISDTIVVKENYDEVFKKMELQWFEVTEDRSFYGAITGARYEGYCKVKINRDYVVSIHDEIR